MKLTVTTLTDVIITLDVSPDMELENFKALCECEIGYPSQEMVITHEGRPLLDNKTDLNTFGVKDGDVLLIQRMNLPGPGQQLPDLGIDFSAIKLPTTPAPSPVTPPGAAGNISASGPSTSTSHQETAERVRQELINFPDRLLQLKQNNPSLAEAFLSGNKELFGEVLSRQLAEKSERELKRIQMLNADPFDPEYQKLIAEEIRQDNVDSNMEAAIEYHPESFGQVTMLYINCKVNGHPVRAFIDSGAQTTIMSQACAERCGIMRLVDKRWSGYAKGVGVQKILGRVHLGHIEINNVFLQSSFSILEDQIMDMLLGLDMLKRHQCCIDLKRNVLIIGTTETVTPFLSESDLPRNIANQSEPTEMDLSRFGPGGNPDRRSKN
ncbi:protein DDI1 homolog 2 [Nephila pilipes]|uniref:Protein DDI1 homolog 2 n=1 Tax=Nephila pilipes TaxID=299642 RepID=A0A8X6PV27_NEPPI|nr:protein DDI1 homolog 2 [Nephila pilipes]